MKNYKNYMARGFTRIHADYLRSNFVSTKNQGVFDTHDFLWIGFSGGIL